MTTPNSPEKPAVGQNWPAPGPDSEFCSVCGYSKPISEGCPTCIERKRMEAEEEAKKKAWDIKRLGGLKAYEHFTFKNYGNQKAIEMTQGYPNLNLYLWGAAGVGKSHLATAVIRQFPDGIVIKPQHILRRLRGLKNGDEEQKVIDKLSNKEHIVIDDLGIGRSTEFALSSFYEIIEARDMSYKKGLIITSNLSLGALAERLGDDRITSRIAGMCRVVEITGPDRRMK